MATYKVIQDIEAEDKLFGPLTLKQFIFACIGVVCGYLSFWALVNGLGFLLIIFLPPMFFFGALAFPWSKEQSTEVWMMAKLRFYFRPRVRIWDQSGIKELVTVTVPKREEKFYTDGLSTMEVKSRLRALADTIDTRGWAVKNVNVNMSSQVAPINSIASDRLVNTSDAPQEVASYDVKADDDIYDERYNSTAQNFDKMIQDSTKKHRQQIVSQLSEQQTEPQQTQAPQPQNDYWFMRQPNSPPKQGAATFNAPPVVMPGQQNTPPQQPGGISKEEEQKILDKIHENQSRPDPMNSHLKTIKPLSEQQAESEAIAKAHEANREKTKATADKPPGNQTAHADILNLAHNDDLNVETIARQAKKSTDDSSSDEVVVSLH